MKVRDVLRLLVDDGWVLVRTRGSHQQFKHPVKPGLVTLAGAGSDDLAPGTLNSEASGTQRSGPGVIMHRYLIVIEPTATGASAYSPDLPGCVASGPSQAEVERAMRDAILFHLDGLRAEGLPLPPGGTSATYVEVAA